MTDISKFPHAAGEANVYLPGTKSSASLNACSLQDAYKKATLAFFDKYERQPEYDILRFQGFFSTLMVYVEIWEQP